MGPSGELLNEILIEAGLSRSTLFITNAVKHFKWEPRGKRRLHMRPGIAEIHACSIWLERDIAAVAPRVIVALGSSALRALTGASPTVEAARRMELTHASGARIIPTYHPSAILRAVRGRAAELRSCLVSDLGIAHGLVNVDS